MPDRLVFVTRKFPPSRGGMETLAAGVWRTMVAARPDAVLIAHGGSNRLLPVWLPGAVIRTSWLVATRRVGFVLTGDALMYAVLAPLLRLFRARHATMVMGLDVTFDNRAYRAVVHRLLRLAPSVIAISAATAEAARGFGVPAENVHVVRLGVSAPAVSLAQRKACRQELAQRFDASDDTVFLLTLGRLVRRKGARWFVENVLPQLPSNVHYVVAGDGPEAAPLRATVSAAGMAHRVHLLGSVDDETRETMMRGADLFVQPNIRVAGDMEGFGLVVIEAALRGTPVVASALEGINDAVIDGETGFLLAPEDPDAWARRLRELTTDREQLVVIGQRFRESAAELFGEESMGQALVGLLAAPSGRRAT
jgi:glycosyltransferase involved in cell wall biosynthesis